MFLSKKYKDDPYENMEEGGFGSFLAPDDYKDTFDNEFEAGSSFNGFVGAFADPYLASFNTSDNMWEKSRGEDEYFHKKEKQILDAYSQTPAAACPTAAATQSVSNGAVPLLHPLSTSPKPESAIKIKREALPGNFESPANQIMLVVEEQPAVEVRTRTPSENRTFSVAVRLEGPYWEEQISSVRVSLMYATPDPEGSIPNQSILGGTKTIRLDSEGRAVFESLCMSEASTRHKEREFRLAFSLVRSDGRVTEPRAVSNPFYAYTHKKVLSRRRNIKLRTLNSTVGSFAGGEQMHVIGSPFIAGPSLRCIMKTPHGDAVAPHIELFSESVLFFTLPPYPLANWPSAVPEGTEVKVQFVVSNDGKTFSNPLDFTYIATGHRSRY